MSAIQTRPAEAGPPRRVTILGSTGSVGQSTVDLLLRNPEDFVVEALTANRNAALLAQQARALRARFAAIADPAQYPVLKDALAGSGIEVASGAAALCAAAERPAEWVMAAIVGAAGLAPTLAAVRRGAIVAFANKEVLVCAGTLFMQEVARCGATLLPVDSEHNAIWQCFDRSQRDAIERVILTASGGPFRERSFEEMRAVTPQQAVAHPNWNMGAKISVDSATMMNKGLEVIEAHHLFQLPLERVEIVVHPQSIVHSAVVYHDGSVLAQLGSPDMRTPIPYALAWPRRIVAPTKRFDLAAIRPRSMRRTRSRSTPFSTGASAFSTSSPRSSGRLPRFPPAALNRSKMSTDSTQWRGHSPSVSSTGAPPPGRQRRMSDDRSYP